MKLSPRILRDPVLLLGTGFGAGLSPRAPGTFGTLVGAAAWLALAPLGPWVLLGVVLAGFAAGIWICGESARRLGVHDHPGIVWDEIVAFLAIMLVIPAGWPWLLAAIVLFRLFDIVKPWPIREIDHGLSGGLGIMLDDVFAALYAALGLLALRFGFNQL